MTLQPCKIFVRASCIYHQQVVVFVETIYNQVVDDPTSIVEQKSVMTHANIELVDVVGQHAIEPIARTSAVHDELGHVRNVEDTDIVPHCLMFLDDAGVLHRHKPATERNHLSAKPRVLIVKWCFLLYGLAHGP